ncbi:diguanylate cyclase [Micromonospora sp. NPDC126480]|uniref:diguanylate cyclase domain-containing protein n=1 Tax=Micromonospora sp. NPDC126480 TaxID=3155312 RepID=UPI00332D077B
MVLSSCSAPTTHDGLTGLLNRPSFTASIAHLKGPEVHVLVIGLENLRLINETLERSAGDGLLAELARRLRAFFPSPDYRIGRISGSGFAVAIGDAPTKVVYHKACRAVLALRVKTTPGGRDLSVRASGGLARGPLG